MSVEPVQGSPLADRSGDHGQAQRFARPEKERDCRPPDSWRYRSGIPPCSRREGSVRDGRAPGTAAAGEGKYGCRAAGDGRPGSGADD